MLRTIMTALVAAIGLMGPAFGQDESNRYVTSFGIPFKVIDGILSSTRKSKPVPNPFPTITPRYFRLILSIDSGDPADSWLVQIRDNAGRVLAAFDDATVSPNCLKPLSCWTRRLTASALTAELSTSSPEVSVSLIKGVVMPESVTVPFYSPFPGSKDEPLTELKDNKETLGELYRSGDLLGMFVGYGVDAMGRDASWCCSGVRVSDDLFVTNWHCGAAGEGLNDSFYWRGGPNGACALGIVDFSWDGDDVGREQSCRSVEFLSKELDIAILRLGQMADGDRAARMGTVRRLSPNPPREGQQLMVLHHPACKPKSITRHCLVWKSAVKGWRDSTVNSDFTHNCTTERGSSGAAIFDAATSNIIGIHHLGADPDREPGNFATRMDVLLKSLEESGQDALMEELMESGVLNSD